MIDFNEIKSKFSSIQNFRDIMFENINNYDRIDVPKEKIIDICQILKEEFKFDQLIDIIGVDRFTKEERFEVIYNLWSNEHRSRLFLKVKLDSKNPEIDSLCNVWPTANWEEREAYDMYGINFINHPDLRRIFMMDEFEYFPLRKDYPLMGIPGAVELPKK
jgi:NADH-quinone oxidoreductase subunit C